VSWLVLVAAAVAACTPGEETSGIDGTGARAPALPAAAYGRVSVAGVITVNGVRYDTAGASVVANGQRASLADLAVGQVVSVAATLDDTSATIGVAQTITSDFAVVGPVESIDVPNRSAVVLGQPVRLNDAVFDGSVPLSSIDGLAVGDSIKISGFRNERNEIVAAWVGKAAPGARFVARAAISDVAPGSASFRMNRLTVDFGSAQEGIVEAGFSPVALADGDVLEVRGSGLDAIAGVLVADQVLVKPTDVNARAGDYVNLEGYRTEYDPARPSTLQIAGLPITKTPDTVVDGVITPDSLTQVKGILTTGGTLVASTLVATTYDVRVPFPIPAGTHVLEGTIFEQHLGPLAHKFTNVFVYLPNGSGYSQWLVGGPVSTDDAGRFRVNGLPDSRVTLWAGDRVYSQPCGVSVDMRGDVTRDIEVMATSAFDSLDPPRPRTARDPTFTGTVFEETPTGKQPLVGATVEAAEDDDTRATTQTDLQGRYFLCDLPQPTTAINVYKDGYVVYLWPVDSTRSQTIDIEFKRTKPIFGQAAGEARTQ